MIAFDPQSRITEFNVKYLIDPDKDFKWVDYLIEKYKGKNDIPKLLILNGGSEFFPKPKEDKLKEQFPELKGTPRPPCHSKFRDLLAMKRVLNMDIIITFQTPDAMPIFSEMYVNDFIVLPVLEEYELDKRSPNYLNLDTCIKSINYYHKKYGTNLNKEYISFNTEKYEIMVSSAIDKKKFNKTIKKFKKIRKRVEIEM